MLKDTLRERLLEERPVEDLRRWYDPVRLDYDENTCLLTVHFPHVHFGPWFTARGGELWERTARHWFREQGLDVRLAYAAPATDPPQALLAYPVEFPAAAGTDGDVDPNAQHVPPPGTISRPTLENFFVNAKNDFPLAAARMMAQGDTLYNPLLFRGRSGTGKTHLLRALEDRLRALLGHDAVYACMAADLGPLLRDGNPGGLDMLRARKALILDDMQFLDRNRATQQRMALLLETLHRRGGLLVCACARSGGETGDGGPGEDRGDDGLRGLDEALRARLEAGLVVELKEPDLDVRLRFAEARCRSLGLRLERRQYLLLAQHGAQMHYLGGIILKTAAFAAVQGHPPDEEDLLHILDASGDRQTMDVEGITAATARRMGFSVEEMLRPTRRRQVVLARQLAMYLCRKLQGTSYPALGAYFGGKDHTTVVHAVGKIKELMVSDNVMQNLVTELTVICRGR